VGLSDVDAQKLKCALRMRQAKIPLDVFSHLAKSFCVMVADPRRTELSRYKAQAQILKALAHPSRLLIVEELSRGERCVCELAELVGAEMPTVSRHLALLREAGIVDDEKRGVQVFYRLRTPCVMNFFQCVAAVNRGDSAEPSRQTA
jgi:ArsR family transcriptional regulator